MFFKAFLCADYSVSIAEIRAEIKGLITSMLITGNNEKRKTQTCTKHK